ncbi:MAG TPA: hypothetical protein VHE37_07840 [Nevskiaceae bacterium]|nr:hypothetical protein [Nevskiaceae bacterium]
MKTYWMLAALFVLPLAASADDVSQPAAQSGQEFSQAGKDIGHGNIGDSFKQIGHGFRDGAKTTGHAIRKGAKATGHAIHNAVEGSSSAPGTGSTSSSGK